MDERGASQCCSVAERTHSTGRFWPSMMGARRYRGRGQCVECASAWQGRSAIAPDGGRRCSRSSSRPCSPSDSDWPSKRPIPSARRRMRLHITPRDTITVTARLTTRATARTGTVPARYVVTSASLSFSRHLSPRSCLDRALPSWAGPLRQRRKAGKSRALLPSTFRGHPQSLVDRSFGRS